MLKYLLYFFGINWYTHDRFPNVRVLSFFLKLFIKIIYGYNLFMYVQWLLKICLEFSILQFFRRVHRFELFEANYLLSIKLIIFFMFYFFQNVEITLFLNIRVGDFVKQIRRNAVKVSRKLPLYDIKIIVNGFFKRSNFDFFVFKGS